MVTFVTDEELSLLRARADADRSSLSRYLHTLVTRGLETTDKEILKRD